MTELRVSPTNSGMGRLQNVSFGIFASATFWLIVATYPVFFFFNPAEQTDWARLMILNISTLAWLTIAIGPAVIFTLMAFGRSRAISALPFVALFWPSVLLINHLHLALTTGNAYFDYLINFPVFFITDVLLPALLFIVWLGYRPRRLKTKKVTNASVATEQATNVSATTDFIL